MQGLGVTMNVADGNQSTDEKTSRSRDQFSYATTGGYRTELGKGRSFHQPAISNASVQACAFRREPEPNQADSNRRLARS